MSMQQDRHAGAPPPFGSFEFDLVSHRTVWSDEISRDYGEGEASYHRHLASIHPDDRERLQKIGEETLAAGGAFATAYRVIVGGDVRWLQASGECTRDGSGAPVRVLGTLQDVTEQRKTQEALRKGDEYFRIVSRATNDAIWDWDFRSGAVVWNEAVERLFGYPPAEVGSHVEWWTSHVHPDDVHRVRSRIFGVIESGGQAWSAEYRFRRRDGTYAFILDRAWVMRDENEQPVRMIGSMLDLTARKEAERRQAELVTKLEAANRDLNDFAYVVSHDLKAPLRAISTLAGWIAQDQAARLDDEGREQLGLLVSRVKRMNDLVDGILKYSRAGQLEAEAKSVDLHALVTETVDLLGPEAHAAVRIEGRLPTATCAKTTVQQIFQNLLSNALKHCDKPEPSICVSCEEVGDFFRFSVRDNGPGIDSRHFERIFQLFQTLAPRDNVESTGIGLALVKKLVELHGGRVEVVSQPGAGSTFSFTWPKDKRR